MSQKAKENILRKIQAALATPTARPVPKPDFTTPIYVPQPEHMAVGFVETFKKNNGEFYYCEDEAEMLVQLKWLVQQKNLRNIFVWEPPLIELIAPSGIAFATDDARLLQVDAGITLCECLIARTGSVLVSSRQAAGRRLTIYPHIHIVVAYLSQLLPDIKDGLELMQQRYGTQLPSMISMIAGPSRTADIEKTLVLGAHGPKELILLLVEG